MKPSGVAQFVRGLARRTAWTNSAAVTTTANPVAQEYLIKTLNARVYDAAVETPLNKAHALSALTNNNVYFKREDMQPVFSFKIRGAYNRIVMLDEEQRNKGVIACSAGNHAQGVAFSASQLKLPATIVMPVATPAIKVDAVRRLGGKYCKVVLHGLNYDGAAAEADRIMQEEGLTLVHPFNDANVIAGQGTIGMEILKQLANVDVVYVCVGGGGMLAGIAGYIKGLRPEIKIVGVEAEDAAGMTASLAAGKVVTLDTVGIFADGAAVRTVGDETFRVCKELVDEMVTVNTDEICAAIKHGFNDTRSIMEPAGALAVAGLVKHTALEGAAEGLNCVAILSGANMDFDRLRFVSERADSREVLLAVQIPEKTGAFFNLYKLLFPPRNVTGFTYRYNGTDRANIILTYQVGVTVDVNADKRVVAEKFEAAGMVVTDLSDNEMAKAHGKYLSGGRQKVENSVEGAAEMVYRFEFPESPGALDTFLQTLTDQGDGRWSVTLFHYRNHGHDAGKVLVGLMVKESEVCAFDNFLDELGYKYEYEGNNPIYHQFLR